MTDCGNIVVKNPCLFPKNCIKKPTLLAVGFVKFICLVTVSDKGQLNLIYEYN